MKHLSMPANIALALILHAYLNAGQAAEPYQPIFNEYAQPNSQGTWFFGSTTPVIHPSDLGEQASHKAEEIAAIKCETLAANLSREAALDRKQASISASKRISILRPNPTRCSVNTAHRWCSNPPTDNFQSGQNSRTTTRSVGPKV